MSTTRHLINRRRRIAARPERDGATEPVAARRAPARAGGGRRAPERVPVPEEGRTRDRAPKRGPRRAEDRTRDPARPPNGGRDRAQARGQGGRGRLGAGSGRRSPGRRRDAGDGPDGSRGRLRTRLSRAVTWSRGLIAVAVLAGVFSVWAGNEAAARRDTTATRNSALTDSARTSEIKGAVARAVEGVFSYAHTEPGSTGRAAGKWLDGAAVKQHREMLSAIRDRGREQKLVLTTTVTDSGIELIEEDRARVLVYADQTNTRTAGKGDDGTTYAAAMFAVDVEHRRGDWRIVNFDTFRR